MQYLSSLPTSGDLFVVFLVGQAYLRGHNRSLEDLVRGVRELPTGLTTPRSCHRAIAILQQTELVTEKEDGSVLVDRKVWSCGSVPSREVLLRLLVLICQRARPAWVLETPGGPASPDDLPGIDRDVLNSLGMAGSEGISAFMSTIGYTRDESAAMRTGAVGEEKVVDVERRRLREMGRIDLAERVAQVSLISDCFGYDVVSYTSQAAELWLEVKTTSVRPSTHFRFHITRHEFNVGRSARDHWHLVAVFNNLDEPVVLGSVTWDTLSRFAPADGLSSQWTQARITLPVDVLSPWQ